jgi:hypothetical protein
MALLGAAFLIAFFTGVARDVAGFENMGRGTSAADVLMAFFIGVGSDAFVKYLRASGIEYVVRAEAST